MTGEKPDGVNVERFVPGEQGEIWIEHWHRYHFAAEWVTARRVLDVACGEGYGSGLLARTAAHVIGIDVDPKAIAHARATYGGLSNVAFECASCAHLPLADASVDVVVSFETIEHIAEQENFLRELARVLAPDGVLILSSPNRLEYSDKRGFHNPFHVRELYRDELARLVGALFPAIAWYGQRPTFYSVIAPEAEGEARAQLIEITEREPARTEPRLAGPLYFILVAARRAETLARTPRALSVLSDRDDWVHKDYEKVMKDLQQTVARWEELGRLVHERDRAIASLQEAVAHRDRLLAEREQEVERRRGWRWWLRLPLVRLGLLK